MEGDTASFGDPVCLLPVGIMVNILSSLSPEDIAGRCGLVSKAWAAVASDPCIWENFCRGSALSESGAAAFPGGWRGLFVQLFRTNLVKCPKFEDLASREGPFVSPVWEQSGNFAVESPPIGCPTFPGYTAGDCVIATSYEKGSITQVIDLRHIPETFLDSSPPIAVSAWYTRRFNCSAIFEMTLHLCNATATPFQRRSSRVLRVRIDTWQQAQYMLEDYPTGLRFINIALSGKDIDGWNGNFGSKFGPVRVGFARPCEVTRLQLPPMPEAQEGNGALWGNNARRRPWFGLNDAAEINQEGLFNALNPLAGMNLRE